MKRAKQGGLAARSYARTVVALRLFVVAGWIAATVAAFVFLPMLGGSSSAPLDDIVPPDAPALLAQQRAFDLFGSTLGADTLVVQRNPERLSAEELAANADAVKAAAEGELPRSQEGLKAAVPIVNVPLPGVSWGESGTTLLTYLFMGDDLNLVERSAVAERYAQSLRSEPGTRVSVTGAGPARLQQYEEIDGVLPIVTIATVLVIVLIVAVYFRSVGAPLVTLLTAGLAYVVATRVLAWSGERVGVTVPSEIEPVLVVLLLGLVTDYTIFFMSETRRRLLRGESRLGAARRSTVRIAPLVFTAGVLVAGGAASLIVGEMQFFRVFGPGMAVCALVVTLVCVTFVPAVLALVGPRLFGRRAREATGELEAVDAGEVRTAPPGRMRGRARERRRLRASRLLGALRASRTQAAAGEGRTWSLFGSRLLASRAAAVPLVIVTVAVLVVAAFGARTIDLAVSHIPSLPEDAEARQGADDAARGLAAGVLSPTELVIEQPGIGERRDALGELQDQLGEAPGVAVVIGPRQAVVEELEPVVLTQDGGAARFALFLDSEPTSADAVDALGRMREQMPAMLAAAGLPRDSRVLYAGETALSQETVDALVGDLGRIGAATALVVFVLLALFLRALVAPAFLLVGSVLAFAAAFGLMGLLIPLLFGGTDVVYYVPLVAAVLLIGLGSDYNVFIAGRIREEAGRRRLSEAIAVGAPAASKAITVAGITLASTFALLAIVPLRPFQELALLLALGVLIDALLVRPLLIPALLALGGRLSWWPSNPVKPGRASDFVAAVARRSGQPTRDAWTSTSATLATLAERIPRREAEELAAQLPAGLQASLQGAGDECEPFSAREFVRRVADRTDEGLEAARQDSRAVVETLVEFLPATEVDYIRAALSEDYRPLFGDATPAPAEGGQPVPAG